MTMVFMFDEHVYDLPSVYVLKCAWFFGGHMMLSMRCESCPRDQKSKEKAIPKFVQTMPTSHAEHPS